MPCADPPYTADLVCSLVTNACDTCAFAKNVSECTQSDSGFIEYTQFVYCPGLGIPGSMVVVVLWLLAMLLTLAITADQFFGTSLIVISETLHLSQNIAGVTLLAFGNGAPDIFSSLAAISGDGGSAGLAIGALLGAGMFVTACTAGAIAILTPFRSMERPLLKDIIFYVIAVFWALVIAMREKIYLYESIGFMVLYVVYVIVTVVSSTVYANMEHGSGGAEDTSVELKMYTPIGPPRSLYENKGYENDSPSKHEKKVTLSVPGPQDRIAGSNGGETDSALGYDTTLENPGGLRRASNYVADRFEDVDLATGHSIGGGLGSGGGAATSSGGSAIRYRQSRQDRLSRMSRVSRVSSQRSKSPSMIQQVPSSRRQSRAVSTTEFGGISRHASYVSRWMMSSQPTDDEIFAMRARKQSKKSVASGLGSADGSRLSTVAQRPSQIYITDTSGNTKLSATTPATQEPPPASSKDNPLTEFLYSIVPIDLMAWPEMSIPNKIYEVIKAPFVFILTITIPVVNFDMPLNNWSKLLNVLHCFTTLFFCSAGVGLLTKDINGFPASAVVGIVAMALAILVYATSSHWEAPRYHNVYAFVGFASSIIWIYTIANEVVNALTTIGIVLGLNSSIIGLTFLAWANSVADMISNTVLARQGFPRIAISACFGGPLFNLLLGFGLPYTIKMIGKETSVHVDMTLVTFLLVAFVLVSLASTLIVLPLSNFHFRRPYGVYLILLYIAFVVLAVMAAANVGGLPNKFMATT